MPERLRRLLWSLLLGVCLARADSAPPAEFWDYLEEFGDAQGELFDPLDLGEAEYAARNASHRPHVDASKNSVDASNSRDDSSKNNTGSSKTSATPATTVEKQP